MGFESSGVEEAVVDVGLQVPKSEGHAAEVVEEPVGLWRTGQGIRSRLRRSEPSRAYGAG